MADFVIAHGAWHGATADVVTVIETESVPTGHDATISAPRSMSC